MDLCEVRDRVDPQMHWRGAALHMIEQFEALGAAIGAEPRVADTHRSKSIDLPVVRFERDGRAVTLLDNFHELDLHYDGPPAALAYEECGYRQLTADGYRAEIVKCEGYSWLGWSEAEILDPRITRVEVTHANGNKYWSEQRPDRKARWIARFESAAWIQYDWSRSEVLGDIAALLAGREPCVWLACSCFVDHRGPYSPTAERFSLVFAPGSLLERAPLVEKLLGAPEVTP